MHHTFRNCKSLQNIDVSNFDTSSVKDMVFMFAECYSLTSLNLANFQTSKVVKIYNIFSDYSSLSFLDISNFNTNSCQKMKKMFYNCSSLISLNLSHFITPLVDNMAEMFSNCLNLKYLDLSNFDFSKITNMSYMFSNCSNLEYINLKNTTIKADSFDKQIFADISKNFVICTSNEHLKYFERPKCSIIECNEIWKKTRKKLFNDSCYDNCSSINLYEYDYKCYESCPENTYNNNYICEPYGNNCLSCLNLSYCYSCKESYYLLFINKSYSYFDKSYEGFYYDNIELNYYQCYSTCKTCNEKGDSSKHNCLKCKDEYLFEETFLYYKNCYYYNNNTKANKIDNLIRSLKFNLVNDSNPPTVGEKNNYENEDKNISIELINTYDEKNKDINNEKPLI